MKQNTQIIETAKKAGPVSVKSESAGFHLYTPVITQHLMDNVCRIECAASLAGTYSKPTSVLNEFLIRVFDVIGAIILLLLTLPLLFFSAVIIKATSRGPVIYKQKRVGKNGCIFTLYKFRTMVDGAEEQTGPVWAQKNDGRVTTVGRFLRCSRIDELPQLFNVLRGDMSLVGPRPERPYFVSRHRALQGIRLSVKPGITGLAQVRAFYDLKPEHKLKYDSLYIQNRSLLLNINILLQTIPVIFLKRGW